jgi:hypothetical protein
MHGLLLIGGVNRVLAQDLYMLQDITLIIHVTRRDVAYHAAFGRLILVGLGERTMQAHVQSKRSRVDST